MSNTRIYYSLLACVAFSSILLCVRAQENPVVQTKLGKIVGTMMKTRLGKDIYAFRSIRYAKAPVDERRFLPPEPVDPWNDTYDATKEGPACSVQYPQVKFSEDCLVLNVYSTELQHKEAFVRKPVIVFIHFGGLQRGAGISSVLGPQYLLDKDVVLVTFNYRLGPLGYISTCDKYAPGNLGLEDQNLVLRFVRDNIEAFGGDPNSVTLTGLSGGSRCVFLHMVSPMSKGLFHRAIAMSGPLLSLEPYPTHQRDLAIKLGNILNCTTENTEKLFACLRTVPFELFANVQTKFREWKFDPFLVWLPVIEPEIPCVKRFLTDQPINLVKTGNYNQVPLITGIDRDELGAFNIRAVEDAQKGDDRVFADLNKRWETLAPISFMYERNTAKSKFVSSELKRFYFNNEPISLKNAIHRAEIYADALTIYPLYRTAALMAEVSKQPVYFYFFNYEGPYSGYCWSNGKPYGACHGDELFYIFYRQSFPMIKTTDKENIILERLTTIWTHFARTAKPIPDNSPLFNGAAWETLKIKPFNYLEIDNTVEMKKDFFPERMKFWEKIFPLQ